MKKYFYAQTYWLTILFACTIHFSANAQFDNVPNLVKGGAADANTFIQAYIKPLGNSFAAGSNAGWYTTARTHKTLGFSVTVFVAASQVPSADRQFDINSLGLTNFAVVGGGSGITQSIAGSTTNGPKLDIIADNPFYNILTNSAYSSLPLSTRTNLQNAAVPGYVQTLGTIPRLPLSVFEGSISPQNQAFVNNINAQFATTGGSFSGFNSGTTQFNAPQGSGSSYMPATVGVQGTVGIIKHIDLIVRYLPTISGTSNGTTYDFGYLGIGAKLGFKQWIPVFKDLPFDMAMIVGYSTLNSRVGLKLTPDGGATNTTGADFSNQKAVFSSSGFNASVVISKQLSFLTLYAGIRAEQATVKLKLEGNYPITVSSLTLSGSTITGSPTVVALSNPVDISYKSPNPIAMTFGFRLKMLWVLSLNADYTLANYQMVTAGFGFDMRERK